METQQVVEELIKWQSPSTTADGSTRASVPFSKLKTLWLNTGTICNLSCHNCYIESTPTNDALVFLSKQDIEPYFEEIQTYNWQPESINITGGEPFINPHIFEILEFILERGFQVLVLTNAYQLPKNKFEKIKNLNLRYPNKLNLRVSLDHYSQEVHEQERGEKTFLPTLTNIKKLYDTQVTISIAGRSLVHEDLTLAQAGYQKLLENHQIGLKLDNSNLVIFPEMQESEDVPEITTKCWKILNISPTSIMCSTERIIVKRKNSNSAVVMACTLIAYDQQFELATTLKESFHNVLLNHSYCSKFCVLGGASCSGN